MHNISESMKKTFGEQPINKTFSILGEKNLLLRETGALKMSTRTGILGLSGNVNTPSHNFHGND